MIDNTMVKRKRSKRQPTVNKTLHRKLRTPGSSIVAKSKPLRIIFVNDFINLEISIDVTIETYTGKKYIFGSDVCF
jgi:hypothetical protein